jgi:hypothetical protein
MFVGTAAVTSNPLMADTYAKIANTARTGDNVSPADPAPRPITNPTRQPLTFKPADTVSATPPPALPRATPVPDLAATLPPILTDTLPGTTITQAAVPTDTATLASPTEQAPIIARKPAERAKRLVAEARERFAASKAALKYRPSDPSSYQRVQKSSKMGIGVYSKGGGHIIDTMIKMKPSVILLMDPDPEFARAVRYWFPDAFIVGRRYVREQPLDNPYLRGQQFADYVARMAVPLEGVVDAWMSYNEAVASTSPVTDLKNYNRFQVAFARRLQDEYGIAAVASNDSVGSIQIEDYPRYFADAIQESAYFGIHAYAPPHAVSFKTESRWYALRYREIHKALEDAGIDHGPIILTETGLWAGWLGHVSEEAMARELMWLSDEMEKDNYVIGQAIYGIFDTGREWQNFDLAGSTIPEKLGRYVPRH